MSEQKKSKRLERRTATFRLCLHCNETKPAAEMERMADGVDLADCCTKCWSEFLERNPWFRAREAGEAQA